MTRNTGKRNRENKLDQYEGTILCLLDIHWTNYRVVILLAAG